MKTLGLLLETTEDIFGLETVRGVLEGIRGRDCRLICFTGGIIRSQFGWESQRNVLYDLVGSANVDGLLLSGVLSHYIAPPALEAFCRGFAPLPLVTLSVTVSGIPAVVVDDRQGFGALLDHLTVVHGLTRLAFVGGTPGQQEAEVRKAVFLEKTEAAGGPTPAGWLYDGDYNRSAGNLAARHFFDTLADQGKLPFQGVVLANDSMAMGFHEELKARGVSVPGDLVVVGYDDLPASRSHDPPLTTVLQSLPDLAARGATMAADLMEGRQVPLVTRLPPRLVVRASCGCGPQGTQSPSAEGTCGDELLKVSRENNTAWEHLDRVKGLSEALQAAQDFSQFLGYLGTGLDRSGVDAYWFSLFEDPAQPSGTARLHLSKQPGAGFQVHPGTSFPAPQLVPGGLPNLEPGKLFVVEVLHSRNNRLGFVVLATDERGSRTTGTLRSQISGALQSVLLLEERKRTERQLIQSEKMASLGSLVAGVAHEINTPLGTAITASSFLSEQTAKFLELYRSGSLTTADAESLLQDIGHAGDAVQHNLQKAAHLVESFKKVSADQAEELRRKFLLREYIDMTLMSMRFHWRSRDIEVTLDGPAELEMDSYPGAVAQVVTSLMTNSLLHAFGPQDQGVIRLRFEANGDHIHLRFEDDGCGIPEADKAKVFEPFFTTKRGKGSTGLGLHIVFNVVTSLLGGTIGFSSAPGLGTRFDLLLPKVAPGARTS